MSKRIDSNIRCDFCGGGNVGISNVFCSRACSNRARVRPVRNSFYEKIELRKDEGCWTWKAACYSNGYGHFQKSLAHRVAWELDRGVIPSGIQVLHR